MKETMIQNIGLFCASGNEVDNCYFEESAIIGRWIGKNKKRLIYGGANVGLMEATAEHVKKHGGYITGIITHRICDYGKASRLPDELIRVETLGERKQIMLDKADVFIALPGGFGTLDEIFTVIAAGHLGYHDKKVIFCNTNGFYNLLIDQIELFYREQFASPHYKNYYQIATNAEECIQILENL
ncbi:MAG: TIGR00730 family Rossman fold protein [Tannerella sp.]|uniref:LOG family protein n=1 Tax=uncultured Coprobacter sp. TaxID=1720550 RepID=UPI002622797A|nr:TIGR00730 family Rossman fold protein [uncultured Coprobacter sp.]MBS6268172.1 TIGR00730 family Rossman fold protein [Tannerella sp.]